MTLNLKPPKTLNRRVKQLDSLATRHRLSSGSRDPRAWQVVEYYERMLGLDLTGMRGWATGLVAKLNKACAPLPPLPSDRSPQPPPLV